MTEERRQSLLQEEMALKFVLRWHTENKERIWDNQQDYEAYINATLDRLVEIKNELNEYKS